MDHLYPRCLKKSKRSLILELQGPSMPQQSYCAIEMSHVIRVAAQPSIAAFGNFVHAEEEDGEQGRVGPRLFGIVDGRVDAP